jgi:hypothetical protein
MKKFVAVAVFLFAVAVTGTFGGEVTKGIFGLNDYVSHFYDKTDIPRDPNKARIQPNYYRPVFRDKEVFNTFRNLEEEDFDIDTDLEWALASYYSPALVKVRPPEAAAILPENNRESPLKLANAVLHKMAEVKFLTPQDTTAVGRYEGMIKFIQDKHGLTRAEIDKYYSDAVRAEAIKTVDTELNKIRFTMRSPTGGYNAVLMRNPQTGQYTLRYVDIKDVEKEISDVSLNALLNKMSKLDAEFNQAGIANVQENAPKIPGVVYAERKAKGEADALALITDALVNLCTNPTQDNYRVLLGIEARYARTGYSVQAAHFAFLDVLRNFSRNLYNKLADDPEVNSNQASRYPADPRYEVFSK